MQADDATIETVAQVWLKLCEHIQKQKNPQVTAAVEKQKNEVMQQDCFLAANLLDNRYRGDLLYPDELSVATEFIVSKKDNSRLLIAQYIAVTGPHSTMIVNREMDP